MGAYVDHSDPLDLMQEWTTYNPPLLWKIFDRILQTTTTNRAQLLRNLADHCLPMFEQKMEKMDTVLEGFSPLYSMKNTTKMHGLLIATNFSKRQHLQMDRLVGTLFNTKSDLIRFMIWMYAFRMMDDPTMDWTQIRTTLKGKGITINK